MKFKELYLYLEGVKEVPSNFYSLSGEKNRKEYISNKLEELWYNLRKNEKKIENKKNKLIKIKKNYKETKKKLSIDNKQILKTIEVINGKKQKNRN